jgi:2-polyprenyl-3-methyl-5-hydroxy-6-metoxy-1,4-benzoquinol methylase
MENKSITKKDASYYNFEKSRIAALIPEGSHRILDIGCAAGRLGRKLRASNKAVELVGVEIFAEAAEEASKYYDRVYQWDIELLEMPYNGHFDFVICGDILEHLHDPWRMVGKILTWLKPGGHLITSVPNIRYWRILRDLMIYGKWEYVADGILDNTHLRFFTKSSFVKLMREQGFKIEYEAMVINGKKQNLFNRLTFGMFAEFLGSQVMVSGRKLDIVR